MKLLTEKEQNRLLRTAVIAFAVVIYAKLRDTLIAEEWLDMVESFVLLFVVMTVIKWIWFSVLGADNRAENHRVQQVAKTAASLEVVSGSDTATASQNNPRNL
jgi:putative effector of murein hydrolase